MSSELNEDTAVDFGAWLLTETAWGLADLEDTCLFTSDGSQTYAGMRGLLPRFVDGTHTASVVGATSTHKTALTLTADDLALLMGMLPERYWANAKFFCSGYMAANCFARLAAVGGGFEMEQDTITGPRPQMSYAGIPIIVTSKMPWHRRSEHQGDDNFRRHAIGGRARQPARVGVYDIMAALR